jgi:beta-lactam-binding protein with PASTA domain/tRNA A-37 threonylcarbamoyl transferase component Bud32
MAELDENSVIDGRYRIIGHVGSGGMADVYRAEDTHLERTVALKLLYRRFAQDQEFVERFRREASAAAALQHPNVVSVYDRGEYDGTYYIAMEFCEGKSLKEVIAREAPLDPQRAIELTKTILLAARFAHRRGVIHRDLKPHNVIIGPGGPGDGVKVADFGIARAGASEITEVGAIMGTAQYLSPEQAQGHAVNEASDLYSLGVVLFEMLTGRPPFEGDSAVAIALKHVNQPPPSPREFRPELPPELEAVVLKALAKRPEDRYLDADSFIRDLETVEQVLAGHVPDSETTARFTPPLQQAGALPAATVESAAATPADLEAEEPPETPEETPPGAGRRSTAVLLAVLAIAAIGVGAFLLLRPEQVEVPLVLGQNVESARAELTAAGFEVDIDRRTDQAPVDIVFRQVPRSSEKVDKGSVVTLFVSNGPSTVKVPDVLGLTEDAARKRLKRAGLRADVEEEGSTKVAEGSVIRSDPGPGVAIERDTRVTLIVSTGPEEKTVPDVIGLDQEDAASRLSNEGLTVVVREKTSSEPVDTVVEQTPASGQLVDEGSTVTIFVSNGKLDEVPDVVGLGQADAEAEIRDAGFTPSVKFREVVNPDKNGNVLSQTPPAGKKHRRGGTIVVTVGQLAEPAPPPASE